MNYFCIFKNALGDDIIFVYPDLMTILVGTFVNGIIIAALPSKINAIRCSHGLFEIKITPPETSKSFYKYFTPTKEIITEYPTLEDPLERKNVFVAPSREVDNELGLFALKDFEVDQVVAYYSGARWNTTLEPLVTSEDETFSGVHL